MTQTKAQTGWPEGSLGALVTKAAERMDAAGLHFGHGTASAFDEACWMAAHALGRTPDFPESALLESVASEAAGRFRDLLDRRIRSRQPLAYLLGEAWFAGLCFESGPGALVPRSPLAELAVSGFGPWLDDADLERAVDVGTGSGCLAVALACHHPEVRVDALDVSSEALELARRNARRHDVEDRVRVLESNLLDSVFGRRYDLILSNPPYVPRSSMECLPAEHRHEPALGLAAGEDGLDLVRRLLRQAPGHLTERGILVVEVGEAQPGLEALLPEAPFLWLEFEHGGEGVFLLDAAGCRATARMLEGRN